MLDLLQFCTDNAENRIVYSWSLHLIATEQLANLTGNEQEHMLLYNCSYRTMAVCSEHMTKQDHYLAASNLFCFISTHLGAQIWMTILGWAGRMWSGYDTVTHHRMKQRRLEVGPQFSHSPIDYTRMLLLVFWQLRWAELKQRRLEAAK